LTKRRERKVQYAALPFRPGSHGVEILLITSRETRRWVIPKGWPMKGKAPHEAAAIEAHEEAGLDGQVASRAIGTFRYAKRLKSGKERPVEVTVFPLRVTHEGDDWPEKEQRVRRWGPPAEAAALVIEPELKALIMAFGRLRLDEADFGESIQPA
jgi:8-oxo-dGTP pyrophosphatase MutT (NUDIX family)